MRERDPGNYREQIWHTIFMVQINVAKPVILSARGVCFFTRALYLEHIKLYPARDVDVWPPAGFCLSGQHI